LFRLQKGTLVRECEDFAEVKGMRAQQQQLFQAYAVILVCFISNLLAYWPVMYARSPKACSEI
jgi:hypothetical protein